jgi:hypothetical protein
MKVKIFALVAAFFMLMGGSAWAQSDVKGDVNKDGVVNEQDIAAILAIMAKNNGVAEKTKYYWYAGWTEPTASNIATIINEADGKAGAYIGTSLGTYSKTNPLAMIEYFDESKYDNYYVVVPEGIKLYDSEGDASLEDQYSATSIVIPGHRIIKSNEQQFAIGVIMLR